MKNLLIAALAASVFAVPSAHANLVNNGGFENFISGGPNFFVNDVVVANNIGATVPTILQDWVYVPPRDPAVWVASPGAGDTVFAKRRDGLSVKLWGPASGSINGLTATSPAGGNYLVDDADSFFSVPITQTISGLTPNRPHTLGFWWGAGQWTTNTGATTAGWIVSLGAETFPTSVVNVPSQGFVRWTYQTFTFTPQNATELLTFLSTGGPRGLPPVALLDGVSLELVDVPEPAAFALLGLGLAAVAMARTRRT